MGSCVRCGEEVREDAKFCGACGQSMSTSAAIDNPSSVSLLGGSESDLAELLRSSGHVVTCVRCGELTRAGAKFCRSCGLGLPAQEEHAETLEEFAPVDVTGFNGEPRAPQVLLDDEVRTEYELFRRERRRNAAAFGLLALATATVGLVYRHYQDLSESLLRPPAIAQGVAAPAIAKPTKPLEQVVPLQASEPAAPLQDGGTTVVKVAGESAAPQLAVPVAPQLATPAGSALAPPAEPAQDENTTRTHVARGGEVAGNASTRATQADTAKGTRTVKSGAKTVAKAKQTEVTPRHVTKRTSVRSARIKRRSLDEMYERRIATECDGGLGGFFCRMRVRSDVCAGQWVDRNLPGRSVCFVARQASAP